MRNKFNLRHLHEWLVPGLGKKAVKVLPWGHTLIAKIKVNIRGVHQGVSPKHLPANWRNPATISTAAFGNRKCSTVCFMIVSTLQPLLSRI
jgi:hypothetical protein